MTETAEETIDTPDAELVRFAAEIAWPRDAVHSFSRSTERTSNLTPQNFALSS